MDEETAYQDPQPDDLSYEAWKFISKFVDRVCIEGYLFNLQKNLDFSLVYKMIENCPSYCGYIYIYIYI